jgi:hypothetical protein
MKKLLLLLLELTAKDIRHKTGEKASVSGVWRSGDEYIPLSRGERFIPSRDGIWVLVCSL